MVVKKDREVPSCVGKTSRTEDNHTIYEFKIPWGFFKEIPTVNEYDMIGFSFCVNDNDGSGRKNGGSYMNGIADGKNTNSFEDMVLIKK